MRIGILREQHDQENRVSCLPDGVAALTLAGHEVLVETGAGDGAGVGDAQFAAAGAVLAGADQVPGARAPRLVSDELVARMRPGTALIDLAVDQGGCFESARATTHQQPTFQVAGSTFYCVANMPAALPGPATQALTHATLPYVERIAAAGWVAAARGDSALARGVNAVDGAVTCLPVAQAHDLQTADQGELLAA
jgi:alanine dehydrogenase